MTLILPRLSQNSSIVYVDGPSAGKPTPYFLKLWDEVCTLLETNVGGLVTVTDATAAQQSITAALAGTVSAVSSVANSAANTASQANSSANPASPQEQQTTATVSLTSSGWVTIASLVFYNVTAATSVTLGDSGPTSSYSQYNSHVTTTSFANVRFIRTVAGVDTTLDTLTFDTDSDGNLNYTPSTYSAADAASGVDVTYRLEAQLTSGVRANTAFLLDVTRNP